MKTNPFITFTAGLAAMLSGQAYAIEGPADDAPPPPAVESKTETAPAVEAMPAAKTEKAYLGVVSSSIPDVLAEHLGIKADEGIVVGSVMPDGPAAKAGISVNDIITRVADQPVNSSLDLTKLVGGRKPGEKVHLDVIHKGKPAGIDVTLGTRPAEMAGIDPLPLDNLNLEGVPKDLADRVRDAIQGNIGRIEMQLGGNDANDPAPQLDDAMRDIRKHMQDAMKDAMKDLNKNKGAAGGVGGIGGIPKIDVQHGATIRMMDGKGSVELKSNDGGKEVTIRDKENKVTWSGPWDTEQDKAAAPDEVRQRMSRLNLDTDFKGNGLRLHMQNIPQGGNNGE